jgi:hypothetical protein
MLQVIDRRLVGAALALAVVALSHEARADEPAWLVDLSAGVPKLSRGGFHVVGGGAVGYRAPRWVVAGHGDYSAYDLSGPGGVQQSERAQGGLEGGLLVPASDRWTLDARLSVDVASYDATTISALTPLQDENSTVYRGAALVGASYRTEGSFAYLRVGGGGQSEQHTQTTVVQAGQQIALDDETKTTVRGEAHAGARWAFAPAVAALRLRVDGSLYSLRRDATSLRITTTGAPTTATAGSTETTHQLELQSRLFVDLDVFAVLGASPAVFVGLDLVRSSSSAGVLSATVPLAGVALHAF